MDEVVADVVVVTAAVVIRDPLVDSVVTTKTQKKQTNWRRCSVIRTSVFGRQTPLTCVRSMVDRSPLCG